MNESKHRDLGSYIREQRERANLSLRRLADSAEISNPYLSQIERGIRRPSAEILKRLSRALEISANSLYAQAGLIDDDGDQPTVTDAIDADQRLSSSQKKVLLDMYKALLATEVGQATTTKQEI
jgi:transcriptional regulator with XRE-family HTH domain